MTSCEVYDIIRVQDICTLTYVNFFATVKPAVLELLIIPTRGFHTTHWRVVSFTRVDDGDYSAPSSGAFVTSVFIGILN